MTIPERLVAIREKNGYTRKRLAEELNRPYRTVTNYETGEREPGHAYIIEIAKKFGVTTDYILGISDTSQQEEKNASRYSKAACKLADAYDNKLDRWGRQAVRELVETEIARCEDETAFREDPLQEEEPKIIPLFCSSAAAGYASPIFGQDFDYYELKPEDPQGAMFAVKVSGDSMEPYFPDGSIAFCNKAPIADGEIGVFCLDGESFIKQYHYNGLLGMTYLFSLNRERADADKLIAPSTGQSLTCMGRVMTRQRFPVPGIR